MSFPVTFEKVFWTTFLKSTSPSRHTRSYRRLIDLETTSCLHWPGLLFLLIVFIVLLMFSFHVSFYILLYSYNDMFLMFYSFSNQWKLRNGFNSTRTRLLFTLPTKGCYYVRIILPFSTGWKKLGCETFPNIRAYRIPTKNKNVAFADINRSWTLRIFS